MPDKFEYNANTFILNILFVCLFVCLFEQINLRNAYVYLFMRLYALVIFFYITSFRVFVHILKN